MRKKIWELDYRFLCPVCGSCISASHLRIILKGCGLSAWSGNSDHQIHSDMIHELRSESGLSRKINSALDTKYKKQINEISDIQSESEILQKWHTLKSSVDVAGYYWALLTHPCIDESLSLIISGGMHMIIHSSFQIMTSERKNLQYLQDKIKNLKVKTSENKKLYKIISENEIEIKKYKMKIGQLQMKLDNGENVISNRVEISVLEKEISVLNKNYEDQMTAGKNLILENMNLRKKIRTFEKNNTDLPYASFECNQKKSCTAIIETDDTLKLENKRILLVGGRKTLKEYCSRRVVSSGGIFEHHDGGIEHSKKRLCSCTCQADVVICVLDCISHNACRSIKKICKRTKKNVIYLKKSGINNLDKEFRQLSD